MIISSSSRAESNDDIKEISEHVHWLGEHGIEFREVVQGISELHGNDNITSENLSFEDDDAPKKHISEDDAKWVSVDDAELVVDPMSWSDVLCNDYIKEMFACTRRKEISLPWEISDTHGIENGV